MSLDILFHFLCTQHVSDINISIIRSLRLCCCITTSVVLFSVRCVLEIWCGWFWVVLVLQAEAQLAGWSTVVLQPANGRWDFKWLSHDNRIAGHINIKFWNNVWFLKLILWDFNCPATGHLDTGFSWFPCVYKQMLRWLPTFQVATICSSCSLPDLNLLVTNFIFCIHVK